MTDNITIVRPRRSFGVILLFALGSMLFTTLVQPETLPLLPAAPLMVTTFPRV